ncbi:protein FAM13B isoform X1 [Gadus chalcogrammus]|uniref:protein FAM13B isoform X1 n=1 Tax=Gadus chalcogrammus TaxID=1042646 RepID=UPI0024C47D1F|nr:protein FAM13B isoform X1 [Gadus chalcogrammus]XP_056456063.1 protein FAM13B isoform X1 [Gadus chalcogrammus]
MRKSVSWLPGSEGVRSSTQVFGVALEEVTHTRTSCGQDVPLLVHHIVQYIEDHGRLDLEGLFLVNGNAERVDWLRQRYDSGEGVELEEEADLAAAVSLLRLFLQELPEPLVAIEIQTHLLSLHQDYSSEEEVFRHMKFLLQQLPQLSYGLLRFLLRFLGRVASVQREAWPPGALATVFGPDIFHLWTGGEDPRGQEALSRVVTDLLQHQDGLFDSDDDDDLSSTNDHSSTNEQEDDRLDAQGEELPRDPEEMFHSGERAHGCYGDEEDGPCAADGETLLVQEDRGFGTSLEDNGSMDTRLQEANISRGGPGFEQMDHSSTIDLSPSPCNQSSSHCDQNANRRDLDPCGPEGGHSKLQLFPGSGLEDPVPAYQRWQEDGGGGEAQLSPLASRMLPIPSPSLDGEESCSSSSSSHHHLLAKRFLDFGAHSTRRFLMHEPDLFHPSRSHRPRRASFSSKEALRASDASAHQLSKKLQHLKKKMKQFEEQFERERNYKPSHGDKAANPKVLKWMTDLTKLRRQIKDARHRAESEGHNRPRSNTLPKSFGSTLEQDTAAEGKGHRPTREETLELVQWRLRGRKQDEGWPDDIKKMTKEQLSCEKTALQKNLLHYEGLHGRPVSKSERSVVKPLYDRYILVKQMLTRASLVPLTVSPSSKRRGQTLQPIIEGETAHFCELKDGAEEEGERREGETPCSQIIMTLDPTPLTDRPIQGDNSCDDQSDRPIIDRNKMEEESGKTDHRLSAHSSSIPELVEQLWKARSEKKRLRSTIKEFEEDFYQHHGRRVQKEERAALLDEYREYKRIKAKLRLLEVLISKQDSSKSI